MLTSLLAEKSVKLKIKIIMNFINEIINPPCNSLLATFLESSCEVCPKTVSSSMRRLARPKRTISQLFKLLFPLPLVLSPKIKLLEREARRVLWEVQRDQLKSTEVGGVCDTEAGTEADVEDQDEDVDAVGGLDEVGVSGYESEVFTLSEILRRKRLEKRVFEGVVDTAHLPQKECSNLHYLPLA